MTFPDAGTRPPDTRPPTRPTQPTKPTVPPSTPPPPSKNSGTRPIGLSSASEGGLGVTPGRAGAGSTPGQSSPRAAGPAPDYGPGNPQCRDDDEGGNPCVGPLHHLDGTDHANQYGSWPYERGGEGGDFTLPATPRPPQFASGSEMRRALQLSLDRRSR